MSERTPLSDQMHSRADADGLPADHQLRVLADEFDTASQGYLATPQTVSVKQFFGAWARALRAWCEYSGEPLV